MNEVQKLILYLDFQHIAHSGFLIIHCFDLLHHNISLFQSFLHFLLHAVFLVVCNNDILFTVCILDHHRVPFLLHLYISSQKLVIENKKHQRIHKL